MPSAVAARWSWGFKLIKNRPLFRVGLLPSTPINEDRLSTSGSFKIPLAKAVCRSAMAAKEMLGGASEIP
jgi:hypothetical protein